MGNKSSLSADDVQQIQTDTKLSEKDIRRLEQRFMKVKSQQAGDSDEVKHISKAVFLQMPENALNPLVERIVSAVATEKPDDMDFPEFCRICGVFAPTGDPETKLKMAFRAYDTDGSGTIGEEEMALVLRQICHLRLTDPEIREMTRQLITKFDRNSDGRIDFEEFTMCLQRSDALSKMSVAMCIM